MNCSSTEECGSGWIFVCAPTGIRTPVVALKGLRPSPLDDGGRLVNLSGRILSSPYAMVKHFVYFSSFAR